MTSRPDKESSRGPLDHGARVSELVTRAVSCLPGPFAHPRRVGTCSEGWTARTATVTPRSISPNRAIVSLAFSFAVEPSASSHVQRLHLPAPHGVLLHVEADEIARLGPTISAVLHVQEHVTAIEVNETPTLRVVKGFDSTLIGTANWSTPTAIAASSHSHAVTLALALVCSRATSDILRLHLTTSHGILLNVKIDQISSLRSATHAILDMKEDVRVLESDETPSFRIVKRLDASVASHDHDL